jgi:enoyl-CoA hydratase/carnithine racemase
VLAKNRASKRGETPLSIPPLLKQYKKQVCVMKLFERGIKGVSAGKQPFANGTELILLDADVRIILRLVGMPYRAIKYSKRGHVARLTLNRPAAGNAVDTVMDGELSDVCLRINGDGAIYVVIITGAGAAFCRGADVALETTGRPAAAIAGLDCPVIAAINGDALGLGLEIALSCDIRLASDKARFALPQLARARLPAGGGTQRLPRLVGPGKALELLLTAADITAAGALEIGLVSKVVPAPSLEAETQELAATVAAKGPLALKYIKEAVRKGMDMTLEQGLRLEADLYFLLHTTADRTEGIKAFREKRPARFKSK